MISEEEIKKSKEKFLFKYNESQSEGTALQKARNAASQRNRLYKKDLPESKRIKVRQYWENILQEKSEKYENEVSFKVFIKDVFNTCREINKEFNGLGYFSETGFRISHGQKSLSVYLKHLWCLGLIKRPPACPVDRRILREAGAPVDKQSWGKTNSICEYARQLNFIKKAAGSDHICDWEVVRF